MSKIRGAMKVANSLKESTKGHVYNIGENIAAIQNGFNEAYKLTEHHMFIKSLSDDFHNSPFKNEFSKIPNNIQLGGNREDSLTHDDYIVLLKKLSSLNEELLNELWKNYANITILQMIQSSYSTELASFPLRELYDAVNKRGGVEAVKELIKVKILLDEFLLHPQKGQVINDRINRALHNKINKISDELNKVFEYCLKSTGNTLTFKDELLIFEAILRQTINEFHKELKFKINNASLINMEEIYKKLDCTSQITEEFVSKMIEEFDNGVVNKSFDFSIYAKFYQSLKVKELFNGMGAVITLTKDGLPYCKGANINSRNFYNAIGSIGEEFNDVGKLCLFNRELLQEYEKDGPLTVNSLKNPKFNCWHPYNNIKNVLPNFWNKIYYNSSNLNDFKKQVKILDEGLIILHQKLDEYIENNNFNYASGGIVERSLLYLNLHVMVELIAENYTKKNIFQAMDIFGDEAAKITVTSCFKQSTIIDI